MHGKVETPNCFLDNVQLTSEFKTKILMAMLTKDTSSIFEITIHVSSSFSFSFSFFPFFFNEKFIHVYINYKAASQCDTCEVVDLHGLISLQNI